ncbi:MAG: hydrogenase iron-sulfur subunit [Armatimonadota bacterium]|nr:hydrogenase iron-sulfur subunit [Armatimonadota bacterium]
MAEEVKERNWEPKIAAFVCNWCTYVGADAAGTSRMQYAPNVRIIRFPCTGRIDPLFIIRAFQQGVDGVIVSGCHPGDCHYVSGNLVARRRWIVFRKFMDFLGLDLRRLHFAWVSATEGAKWARLVNEIVEQVQEAGPAPSWAIPTNGATKLETPLLELELPSSPPELTEKVRELAKQLLEEGKVGVVVGYEMAKGAREGEATPTFINKPEDADRLVFNEHCVHNLAVYLTNPLVKKFGKIGIVAKGCDIRSIVGLIQESQIKREDVSIIGVVCNGVVVNGKLANKCVNCQVKVPHLYDHLVGDPNSVKPSSQQHPLDAQIAYLESLSPEERWNFWMTQFARCIRCYACRAVCPLCYCQPCIAEKHRPQWIPTSPHPQGNLAWNIIRAWHLAGRCIGCGECYRACPVNIRLDLINRKLALEVEQAFGYRPGFDLSAPTPLSTHRTDDKEDFIR